MERAMNSDFSELQRRIRELENENSRLREKIDFLEGIPTLRKGLHGESIISLYVGGRLTAHTARHDVEFEHSGLKLEVKNARLNLPNKKSDCQRWAWRYPLGLDGRKVFDRLILMGEADPRYRNCYRDPSCPYVLFDLPYDQVPRVMTEGEMINATTNPNSKKAKGTTRLLFRSYETCLRELKEKYGISDCPEQA
jgi:hypothetical protein